jgi:phthiodiolone/phenolphthiodiolone dimycocerosates ketoreductase
MIITLDHISKGRIILGIGAGEGENIVPYGIKWEKPVSRLEEAIKIIKLLWEQDKKVDFNGQIWKLNDAILSLKPFKKRHPPSIWVAAHGPKMLELTGKLGDGWLPIYLNPEKYKEGLNSILTSAKKEGRNSDELTPGVYFNLITDEKPEECDRMLESPLAKNHMLVASNEQFQRYGIPHPLGDNVYGIKDYIPTKYDKETILELYNKIPIQMCKDFYLNGTPDEIIGKIEEFAKIGAEHIVIFNHTTLCDVNKITSSYICIKKVLDYFKGK